MNKYEISLWEDYLDTVIVNGVTKTFLNERKICIIGADSMTALVRALEPKLTQNVNGTHTFTFKMFYKYNDTETGEEYENPFLYLLVNERKIKVYWENEWYDLVIKKCQENTKDKTIIYTCTDLFINELSKNGFELNFCTDLENNIGVVSDLAEATLKDTTWLFDSTNSDLIFLYVEESVYEKTTSNNITCVKLVPGGIDEPTTITSGSNILAFYSCISAILDGCNNGIPPTEMQILYSSSGYQYKLNSVVVANGDCYLIQNISSTLNNNILTIKLNNNTILVINVGEGISLNYRAERLVKSPLSEFDNTIGRYVTVCKLTSNNKKVYLVETTDYTDPLAVVNIIANPNLFKNVNGWIPIPGNTNEIEWLIYPKFTNTTDISTYTAKSYIKLAGTVYNAGLNSNISYFTPTNSEIKEGKIGGFEIGEKYIFRFKAVTNSLGSPTTTKVSGDVVTFSIKRSSVTHAPSGNSYCSSTFIGTSGDWVEYEITFNLSVSANEVKLLGIFITPSGTYWFEEILFFKLSMGKTSYSESSLIERMEPGQINLLGIVEKKYKYYYPDLTITDPKDLTFIYVGTELNSSYPIQYNNYEKLASINIKQSNRFNILLTIAETFKCWVRFRIEHESNGKIKFINGVPLKFVIFKAEIGEDNSVCFEYGIDLKAISRNVDSDNLATKVIVLDNTNEFAPNGFCTIMRASENYSKASFILNFDYYVLQGLLSKELIQKDLYGTSSNDIGYYYYLRWYNRDYDNLSSELSAKLMQLTKQNSLLTTYKLYLTAAEEKKNSIMADVMALANVTTWANAQTYASNHADNTKVQSLLNAYAEVDNLITYYLGLVTSGEEAVTILKNYVQSVLTLLNLLINNIEILNKKFNEKYANYIQEGTWQDGSYSDDNRYYLDAVGVAYTSSRPQITYSINVIRLNTLEEYSSKVFHVGDICYIIDREYFGYSDITTNTPYKEQIVVTEITSNFDSPEKDVILVKNYKTRFDDLFQRIAAQTQHLTYAEGDYARAAEAITSERTLSFSLLQDTFDMNENLVLNASNQNVTWDETGITVTNKLNAADKTKIIAGGIFVTNDGGITWKNAVRGDGISTDLLTAGRINTSEIYVYDGNHPSFRWDSDGLTAYWHDSYGSDFGKFVRHDRFGIYGYAGASSSDFIPNSENNIWDNPNTKFALTWKGFMLKTSGTGGSVLINSLDSGSVDDIVIKATNSDGATTFALHENGNVDLGGNVTWNSESNPTKVVYNQSSSSIPTRPTWDYNAGYPTNYDPNTKNGWHTALSTIDRYASYNYSGGAASQWSDAVLIVGSDADVDRPNIVRAMVLATTKDGLYTIGSGSSAYLGIRATAILAGTIDAAIEMTSPTIYTTTHSSYASTGNGFYLSQTGLSIGSGFSVDSKGNMTLSGNITWNTNSNPTKVIYNENNKSVPSNTSYGTFPSTSSSSYNGWHKALSSNDKYGSYSYNGGTANSWSMVVLIVGKDGINGTSIQSVNEYYVASSNSATAPTSGWSTSMPSLSTTNKYLWNKELITYSTGSLWTIPAVIGTYSKDGKGISSITERYLATSASSGVTRSTSGWTTAVLTVTNTKKYLWNYETINYTEGDPTYTTPAIIGVYGDKGSDATVNRANIMASLLNEDYSDDGIYAKEISGKNCIGIRATAIQAGIISAAITMTSPTIYSGSHSTLNSTNNGFYLSSSGLSIGNGFEANASGSIQLRDSTYGRIYSGSHTGINSTNAGFYLGKDGLSIGNGFKATAAGDVYLYGATLLASRNSTTSLSINEKGITYDGTGWSGWSLKPNSDDTELLLYTTIYRIGISAETSIIMRSNGPFIMYTSGMQLPSDSIKTSIPTGTGGANEIRFVI